MCRKINCSRCGKATWTGCGMHIDSALNGVAETDRCPGWKLGKCITAVGSNTQEAKGCKVT